MKNKPIQVITAVTGKVLKEDFLEKYKQEEAYVGYELIFSTHRVVYLPETELSESEFEVYLRKKFAFHYNSDMVFYTHNHTFITTMRMILAEDGVSSDLFGVRYLDGEDVYDLQLQKDFKYVDLPIGFYDQEMNALERLRKAGVTK